VRGGHPINETENLSRCCPTRTAAFLPRLSLRLASFIELPHTLVRCAARGDHGADSVRDTEGSIKGMQLSK
jgi:hypothetical protein